MTQKLQWGHLHLNLGSPQVKSRQPAQHARGAQGKAMTQKLHALHAEAAAAHAKVQALAYDPLDTAETAWVVDCAAYNAAMQELERRLAAIVSQVRAPMYTF